MSTSHPLMRVHHAADETAAHAYSVAHPGILVVWATAEDAGSYYDGVKCGIPYCRHQWVQGIVGGSKIWTPPPDLLTWWEGEPNNSTSVLAVRVPHNNPGEAI